MTQKKYQDWLSQTSPKDDKTQDNPDKDGKTKNTFKNRFQNLNLEHIHDDNDEKLSMVQDQYYTLSKLKKVNGVSCENILDYILPEKCIFRFFLKKKEKASSLELLVSINVSCKFYTKLQYWVPKIQVFLSCFTVNIMVLFTTSINNGSNSRSLK